MQDKSSILNAVGFRVVSCASAVYRLASEYDDQEFVGLLHTEKPLTPVATALTLLKFGLEPGVSASDVMAHWKNLDARRIEGTGVESTRIRLPPNCIPHMSIVVAYPRPSGFGMRHASFLTTGDIVCYN